jgi:hypothetical protein
MGGETDNLPTRRRTNSALGVPSAVIAPKKEDAPYVKPTLMRCRYYYVGCHEMIESPKFIQHMEDYQREHLRLLESTVALQSQKISHMEAAHLAKMREEALPTPREPAACPPPVMAAELVNAVAELAGKHVASLIYEIQEFMSPKADDDAPGLKTWQILHLFVLSFVVLCYFSLAGMGRLWALLQFLPLVTYGALMSVHWWYALLFSSAANTVISLGVVCLWVGINLFLPVF